MSEVPLHVGRVPRETAKEDRGLSAHLPHAREPPETRGGSGIKDWREELAGDREGRSRTICASGRACEPPETRGSPGTKSWREELAGDREGRCGARGAAFAVEDQRPVRPTPVIA
jgi:hypothetical protein